MNLVYIFGPSAVGKYTVGNCLSKLINYPLLDQHAIMEIGRGFFRDKSPNQFRFKLIMKHSSLRSIVNLAKDNKGIIFSDLLYLENPDTYLYLHQVSKLISESGGNIYFIELSASQKTRLIRNKTERHAF